MGEKGNKSVEWLELANGCVCCSVRNDLVTAIETLIEKQREKKFDCILVETDGLAKPGPVAAAFWVDDELESRNFFYLQKRLRQFLNNHKSALPGWHYHRG